MVSQYNKPDELFVWAAVVDIQVSLILLLCPCVCLSQFLVLPAKPFRGERRKCRLCRGTVSEIVLPLFWTVEMISLLLALHCSILSFSWRLSCFNSNKYVVFKT